MEYRVTSKQERIVAVCHELSIARTIADSLGSNYRVVAWERQAPNTLFDFPISTRPANYQPRMNRYYQDVTREGLYQFPSIVNADDDMRTFGIVPLRDSL